MTGFPESCPVYIGADLVGEARDFHKDENGDVQCTLQLNVEWSFNNEARKGLYAAIWLVERFHEKNKVSSRGSASSHVLSDEAKQAISTAATQCIMASQHLAAFLNEDPCNRGHLIAEEAGEYLESLLSGDEVKVLDALADLLYVVLGGAIHHDLPLATAFLEVHRSNMTKERQADDEQGERIRNKGPNFEPPRLKELLEEYRNQL